MPAKQKAKQAKVAAKQEEDKGSKAKEKAATPAKSPAKAGVKKTKSEEQIVKVVTKGGAAVDAFVPLKSSYRVLQDSNGTYAATLNQSNLGNNNNKFYIIQVLQHESSGGLFFWSRWGRVGVPGQNNMIGPLPKPQALSAYQKKRRDKISGGYKEIEISYDDGEEEKKKEPKAAKRKEVASKMEPCLQNLVKLIFDVNIMNNTMKEIGYDAKKMPLGKLGEGTIKAAYGILSELSKAVKKKDKEALSRLSGDFYTLIPHDFGFQNMAKFVLDNEEKIKAKAGMLATISDLKVTSKLLDQKGNDDDSILDQNYKKLGCEIKSLDKKSEEYKLMLEYFNNTKGKGSKVTVSDIFEVNRPTEQAAFNKRIGNNMLLWHGSGLSNFTGILSQGMRIAPPEAPVSGYAYGKGIYMADMAGMSIGYCRAYGSNEALILLLEVNIILCRALLANRIVHAMLIMVTISRH